MPSPSATMPRLLPQTSGDAKRSFTREKEIVTKAKRLTGAEIVFLEDL